MRHSNHHFLNLLLASFFSLFIIVGCNDAPSTEKGDSAKKETVPEKLITESGKNVPEEKNKVEKQVKKKTESAALESIKIVTQEQYLKELEQHKGKVVFVDFWATWCINCIKGMKHTVELSEEFKKEGLVIIMMCLDDNNDKVQARAYKILAKRKIDFPSLMAKDGSSDKAFSDYKIEGEALPHYKLYGRDGKLIHAFVSTEETAIDYVDVKKKISEAMKK